MEILSNGIWVGKDAPKHHQFDQKLADGLIAFLKQENVSNVIDIGCGLGLYTKTICDNGIKCDGEDGNPDTPFLTDGRCKSQDILTIGDVEKREVVLCLEVAEHIPVEHEQTFVSNLVKYDPDILIVSWAVLNQGGDGHVNERDNGYVISVFNSYGYMFDYNSTITFRTNYVTNCWWFKQSMFVFRKFDADTITTS